LTRVLHPVGSLPASVYWRSRGIAVGAMLLAVLLVWLLFGRGGPGGPGGPGAGKPDGGTGVAAGPSPSGTPHPSDPLAASGPADDPGRSGGGTAGSGGGGGGTGGAAGGGAGSGGAGSGDAGSGGAGQGGSGEGGAGPSGTAGSGTAGGGGTSAGGAGARPGPCADGALRLTVAAARPSYPVGSRPVLSLSVKNVGAAACVRDLASSQQEVLLYAGGTRLWSSNDCYPGGGTDLETIAPGGRRTYPVTWSGLASEPGCPAPRARVPAGRYTLTARIGTLRGSPATLTLT
jgi:hypothetical protein